MQPRQRSKCSTTVELRRSVPWAVFSISWMRPRGESISSFQRTYVGQVGRQKPQWTQALVSSSITSGLSEQRCAHPPAKTEQAQDAGGLDIWRYRGDRGRRHAKRLQPRGGVHGCSERSREHSGRVEALLQRAVDSPRRRVGDAADTVRHVGDAGSRAHDRLVEGREDVREVARRESRGGRATGSGARGSPPRSRRPLRSRRGAPAPTSPATQRPRPSPRRGRRPDRDGGRRPRSAGGPSRAERARPLPVCRSPRRGWPSRRGGGGAGARRAR